MVIWSKVGVSGIRVYSGDTPEVENFIIIGCDESNPVTIVALVLGGSVQKIDHSYRNPGHTKLKINTSDCVQ